MMSSASDDAMTLLMYVFGTFIGGGHESSPQQQKIDHHDAIPAAMAIN